MSVISFLFVFFCYGFAIVLMMDWFFHALPGGLLNPLRRFFFYLGSSFLETSRGWFSFQWKGIDSRGLGLAFALWMVGRFGVPWLVIWCFTLKG